MIYITFGLAIPTATLIWIVFLTYIITLLILGWESHSKYGLGYYCVGGCLLGLLIAYLNYKYWLNLNDIDRLNYSQTKLIAASVILTYMGLWPYLVFHFYSLKQSKAMRAGTRLMKRVLAGDSDESEDFEFTELLSGWEGDGQINHLIAESRLKEAASSVNEEIQKARMEKNNKKASNYEQYKSIIARKKEEAVAAESAEQGSKKSSSEKSGDVDLKRDSEIDDKDLPEGWEVEE